MHNAALFAQKLLTAAAALGALWLAARYLLPWLAPFGAAFALAALLERVSTENK